MTGSKRVDAYLVAGGKYHDIDFARLELLKLMAEHDFVRVQVAGDYEAADAIAECRFLVSYTCDVRPSEAAQRTIRAWVEEGGRWVALHGTNSALERTDPTWSAPRCFPLWADTLGSQFVAHPPIAPYRVEPTGADHWLVRGVTPFDTDDELYLSEYHGREQLLPLLHTRWQGTAKGFTEADWTDRPDDHLVMYLRELGEGAVLYNTLGHCRGHWDMVRPLGIEHYPKVERCSWNEPQYYELLRRSLRWAMGAES